MEYLSPKGKSLLSFQDWEDIFLTNPKKKIHWQKDRSAYNLANFMFHENGEQYVKELISEIIGENLVLEKAIPELETKFDRYRNGREHDLGIWGKTDSGKSVFIGVESKVDEKFNCKISEAYLVAKTKELNKTKTEATNRIEELLNRSFNHQVQKNHWNLMYQLFYTLFGTLDSKDNGKQCEVPIMLFIVFKTSSYKNDYGTRNYKDYVTFINQFNSIKIECDRRNIDAHVIEIEDKKLFSIYCQL
ncbi:DUF6946 family protein [Flavobacterium sp. 3HN19-14]|uniref:DUF6946 family protein n=1 Tax=Flavobacterium sp. 3HN19-14 TaxID=3448133 RepID=UPI003EDFC894